MTDPIKISRNVIIVMFEKLESLMITVKPLEFLVERSLGSLIFLMPDSIEAGPFGPQCPF